MSETKRESVIATVHYEGLDFQFEDLGTGYNIKLLSDDPKFAEDKGIIAEAQFGHGYILGFDKDKHTHEDEDVLAIVDASNYDAPPGTATKLIKFGLEEGKRRGFTVARAGIHNPKIVTILEKLKAEGTIAGCKYFPHPSYDYDAIDTPTEDLPKTYEERQAEAAITYLNSFESYGNGFVDEAVVDCAIEL